MDRFKLSCPLPQKETKLFKKAVKCYEQHNYKNGIKFCRQILSNPRLANHLDTMSILSTMLHMFGQKEEAIKTIKHALSVDIKSSVCWHAYCLIHKYNHNYEEAIKCMRQALKLDPDNAQLLIELGSMQMHLRDCTGALESRQKLLKLKPAQRQIWLSYIMSLVLADKISVASIMVKAFIESINENEDRSKNSFAHQYSNIVLLQIKLCMNEHFYTQALDIIQTNENLLQDKLEITEIRVRIMIELKQTKEAVLSCIKLLRTNPENREYYTLLFDALSCVDAPSKIRILNYVKNLIPSCSYPSLLLLEYFQDGDFVSMFSQYAENAIEKSRPNLYSTIKFLYAQQHKILLIEKVLLDLNEKHSGKPSECWLKYCLSKHYNSLGQFEKALEMIESVLIQQPSLVDAHILKGTIHKNLGSINKYIQCLSQAYLADTSDRYATCLYANNLIKYCNLKEAQKVMDVYVVKPKTFWCTMKEIQCLWLFVLTSKMFLNMGDIMRSYNICILYEKFFKTFDEDPMDFHMYCIRKYCLKTYWNFYRHSLSLRDNNLYLKVARTALKCVLALMYSGSKNFDEKSKLNGSTVDFPEISENPSDPCLHVKTFLHALLNFDNNIKNYWLAFEYYTKDNKILILLKLLLKIKEMAPTHPRAFYCHIVFLKQLQSNNVTPFSSDILQNFKEIQATSTEDILKMFPSDNVLSPLYTYKSQVFLGLKSFDPECYTHIFDESISTISAKWIDCYNVYKEFISPEMINYPEVKKKITAKMMSLFPDCCLNNRTASPVCN